MNIDAVRERLAAANLTGFSRTDDSVAVVKLAKAKEGKAQVGKMPAAKVGKRPAAKVGKKPGRHPAI